MSKTKFKNAQTIVTDDFLNSMYGGLEGTSEGSSLNSDDPRIKGHVHDGVSEDGHASKIDLVSHVTNQLTNTNLADDAVLKRNVYSSTNQSDSNLIPYYELDSSGNKNYYLNLGEFDLQTITDNGFQTTNQIVVGYNDKTETYDSSFVINNNFLMMEDGCVTQENDNILKLKLSRKDLFFLESFRSSCSR